MLCLLASYSILTCSHHTVDNGHIERLYSLAPVSRYYLKDAVQEGGIPFNVAHEMEAYTQGTDPRFKKVFNKGMSNYSTITMKKIADTYKGFEGLTSLVDVGGEVGTTLQMIVSKYPSLRGINFDLPHVISDTPSYPRVDHAVGDRFVSVPKADAILLKWICHNWSDDHCLKLLKNCYDALADDGKVIVVDYILSHPRGHTRCPEPKPDDELGYSHGGKVHNAKREEELQTSPMAAVPNSLQLLLLEKPWSVCRSIPNSGGYMFTLAIRLCLNSELPIGPD
ncbi:hypothetical protein NE237_008834 [Protea cynaroides]|uniref:O-methyltransferase C-terminal domain-containing protein n=1 Tax=Protea cynaroides TaxID=273540 RepID=A0A9Q0KXH3_9MAGN|nr:hypothetical protein NE237_008834 [Protea cynaroides]